MTKRKKILLHSDFSLAFTGFGKNARNILTYLYKTGKYDIVHYCCNMTKGDPKLPVTPWKSVGCIPNYQHEIDSYLSKFKQEERDFRFRQMCYGEAFLDEVINEERPDVYIGVQDFWGVDYAISRGWFRQINSVIWTTLDSLPLHPPAIEKASRIKNYWLWSSFATKDLHRLGHTHAKTVHGPINTSLFYRLPDLKRDELRKRFNIPLDTFVIGGVFRNQLRKSVPNMLRGYKLWKEQNPTVKSKILFHTSWVEGWNIHKRAEEFGIDKNDILTTYICKSCKEYEIKPFVGHGHNGKGIPCRYCGEKEGQLTTNVSLGVDEDKLNEIYNLMNVFLHAFSSGGQEIPIQEAKLTELISLITNYSCGAEMCEQPFEQSGTLPLDWDEYREQGTEFIKASTSPESIADQLNFVYNLSRDEKREREKTSRQWVIDNYSLEVVGKQIEELIDAMPDRSEELKANYWGKFSDNLAPNPNAIIPFIMDNFKWLETLYREILKVEVDEHDDGVKHWLNQIKNGAKRPEIENYFRQTASKELVKRHQSDLNNFLDQTGRKRFLIVAPESIGDLLYVTCLLKSFAESYPEWDLYLATKPEYFGIFDGNPYIYKVIPYHPVMDSEIQMTGAGANKGYFNGYSFPCASTQRFLNYLTNDNISLKID